MIRRDFMEALDKYGATDVLDRVSYQYHGFENDNKLFNVLDDIVYKGGKVLVHGDSDPDGLFSLKIVTETFDKLGFLGYEVYQYKERSHVLTDEATLYPIYNNFTHMIILDSSSNDMRNITRLSSFGVNVIIIDHHVCDYDYSEYPNNCTIINTTVENRIRRKDFYTLSAGALTFMLFGEYLRRKGEEYEWLSSYGLITLYSDSIDMSSPINRSIYYLATGLPKSQLPLYVRHFMSDYQIFNRRFIEFTFSPKINTLFRAEKFDLLNSYMFDENSHQQYSVLVDEISMLHEEKRKMVSIITDAVRVENLNNLVIANLATVNIPVYENKLYNYTGLVANNLSSQYGKPCVVLCDAGTGIKGSFRDSLSRNYLKVFRQFSNSNGHNAAFGINISYRLLDNFLYYLKEKIDKKFFILGVENPIELTSDGYVPIELLEDIAKYNEFSGNSLPMAIILKKNDMKVTRVYDRGYRYQWGDLFIESTRLVPTGGLLKIKPVYNKRIKLVTVNRDIIL